MNEIGFFAEALKLVKSGKGVIVIVAMFIFSGLVAIILSKIINITQNQSFILLIVIFVGVFIIVVYAMTKQNDKGNTNIVKKNKKTDIKIKNSTPNNKNNIIDNQDSQVNISN